MKRCNNCNELIKDELEVCPFCGYIDMSKPSGNRIRNLPLWVKIAVPSAAVLVVVAVVLLTTGLLNKDEELSEIIAESGIEDTVDSVENNQAVSEVGVDILNMDGHSFACYFGCDSWEQARDYCESVGGHLAVITTPRENEALYAFARYCGYDNVYIGYSDTETEGHWRWVNGEQSDYTNWNAGEPNGFTTSENYAVMVDNGCWNDGDYSPRIENGIVAYICEWDYEVEGINNFNYEEIIALVQELPEPSDSVVDDSDDIVAGVPDGDYCAVDYTFADDGQSGEFHLYTYDSFTREYIDSLREGDLLPDGEVITGSVEEGMENSWYCFEQQSNGEYYFFDIAEVASMTEYGVFTMPISPNVTIWDCADPFGINGIYHYYEDATFSSVHEFNEALNDEEVICRPDLFIRVVGGQIIFIITNPWNHQPWRYVLPDPTATPTPVPVDESIINMIFAYYGDLMGTDCMDTLEVFDREITQTENGYQIIVRTTDDRWAYVRFSEATPTNVFFSSVNVNMETGIASDDLGHTWNISDYM